MCDAERPDLTMDGARGFAMEILEAPVDAAAPIGEREISLAPITLGDGFRHESMGAEFPEDSAQVSGIDPEVTIQPRGRAPVPGLPEYFEHAQLRRVELIDRRRPICRAQALPVKAIETANGLDTVEQGRQWLGNH